MEDVTLAAITVASFAVLFLVATFADRAGAAMDLPADEPIQLDRSADLEAPAADTGSRAA